MNPFSMNFVAGLAEFLTLALAHFVWQGAGLALILLATMKLFDIKAARIRYLLSVATLLLMGMAPIVTAILHHPGNAQPRSWLIDLPGQTYAPIEESSAVNPVDGLIAELPEDATAAAKISTEVYLLCAWLVGVFILSTRLVVGFGITVWIRGKLTPLSEDWERRVRTLGSRLRVDAGRRVFTSMRVCQAVAIGFLRPVVLIPASWLTQFSPQMIEAIIAHELAHIRRWDLWVNLVQRIIETLLFYHPAVWWLSSRIRFEREMCCDEMAAECFDRLFYVRSLESVAKLGRENLLMATAINGGKNMKLLTRVRNLLGAAPVDAAGNWWAVGLVAVILPFAAAVAISLTAVVPPAVATTSDDTVESQSTDKIVAVRIVPTAVSIPQRFSCKINAHRHIEVRALTKGFLETIPINEGQQVKQGDLLFAVNSTICQTKFDAANAEFKDAQTRAQASKALMKTGAATSEQLRHDQAKVVQAQTNAALAEAELNLTRIKAPFAGIVGSLRQQVGSLALEGDVLTTLSDNSALWVYFNVPETRYLEYMAELPTRKEEPKVELLLANGKKFNQVGTIKAIEANFNNATGTIAFRADFPNPERLLRHGQSGTVLLSQGLAQALVIPKTAAFRGEQGWAVYVLDKEDVAHQRPIDIQNELEDLLVIKSGVDAGEKIIVEGIQKLQDGKKVKYELRKRN